MNKNLVAFRDQSDAEFYGLDGNLIYCVTDQKRGYLFINPAVMGEDGNLKPENEHIRGTQVFTSEMYFKS